MDLVRRDNCTVHGDAGSQTQNQKESWVEASSLLAVVLSAGVRWPRRDERDGDGAGRRGDSGVVPLVAGFSGTFGEGFAGIHRPLYISLHLRTDVRHSSQEHALSISEPNNNGLLLDSWPCRSGQSKNHVSACSERVPSRPVEARYGIDERLVPVRHCWARYVPPPRHGALVCACSCCASYGGQL
jgi:hypothetical protein